MSHILVGDALAQLKTLASESVHCIVTSPPYWGLRNYGVDGQIGLEEDFEDYLDRMVAVFAAARRVLRKDGTCWVNMGDCYASDAWGGSPGAVTLEGGRDCFEESKKARTGPRLPKSYGPRAGSGSSFRRDRAPRMDVPHRAVRRLRPKEMVGMPWRVAFALQADGWYLRSEIIWHKPSAMPESVKDRPTRAHEQLFLFTKSERYFYDNAAIREPVTAPQANTAEDRARAFSRRRETAIEPRQGALVPDAEPIEEVKVPAGWDTSVGSHGTIHREGRSEPEYRELGPKGSQADRDESRAAASSRMGRGAGWRKDQERVLASERGRPDGAGADRGVVFPKPNGDTRNKRSVWTIPSEPFPGAHFATFPKALVRPCILAGSPRGGMVLDPFLGSGTTGVVADEEGRDWIGIELNPVYAEMARRRTQERQETIA